MLRMVLSLTLAGLFFVSVPQASGQTQGPNQAGRLLVGANVGLHAGTPDDTVFGLVFHGDYFLDNHLSVGPMLQFGIGDDLFHVGISGQAKYTFVNPRLPRLRPHLQGGLGFITIDVDKPPPPADDDDIGFLVPFGGGIELALGNNALIGTTLLLNFTDAEVPGQGSNLYMTWVFGLRIRM